MPTTNRVSTPVGSSGGVSAWLAEATTFWAESVSFTSSVGLNVSNRTVPANRAWWIQTARLLSAETSKYYEFYADDGTVSYMTFHDAQLTLPATASDPVGIAFQGRGLFLPSGWRFGIKIDGAAGALATNWQYTAFEVDLD